MLNSAAMGPSVAKRIRLRKPNRGLVPVVILIVVSACGSSSAATSHAASPQGVSVSPTDFTTSVVTCSQSAQIDDFATATRQVIHDWASMQNSGAVNGWIQAVASTQQDCDAFFNAEYAPNSKIAVTAVIQFKDSTEASYMYGLGVPDLNLFSSQFDASAPGAVTGNENGLGPNSVVLARTDYDEWDAFWQHSSFLVEFSAWRFGDTEAKKAALHVNERIPDIAPTPSPMAARPSPPPDCRNILDFAPSPASATMPAMSTKHLIAAGGRGPTSIAITVPSDLTISGGQVKDANSLLAVGPASGFYPQLALEFYEHTGTMPDAHSLAAVEARSTENDPSLRIIPPVVVGLLGMVAGTPGRLDICMSPEAGWPDPHTVVIQFVFPRAARPGVWDEYLVQVITTVDRYQYDSLVAYAVAASLRVH